MSETRKKPPVNLKDFFERIPPGTWAVIDDFPRPRPSGPPSSPLSGTPYRPTRIDLDLQCETCSGTRKFATNSEMELADEAADNFFITYFCRNCRMAQKTFAVWASRTKTGEVNATKYGEYPAFGPPLPSKLIDLIRPEYDYFLKGRRAESQGMGIGSFAYYRRVIEGQKGRILDEIVKAATKLGAPQGLILELQSAMKETQFTKAIEGVKQGIPQALWIDGANPLTLLHSALSIGLHGGSDEECLAGATDIRLVMTALAERLDSVLKDEKELHTAVSRLLNRNNPAV